MDNTFHNMKHCWKPIIFSCPRWKISAITAQVFEWTRSPKKYVCDQQMHPFFYWSMEMLGAPLAPKRPAGVLCVWKTRYCWRRRSQGEPHTFPFAGPCIRVIYYGKLPDVTCMVLVSHYCPLLRDGQLGEFCWIRSWLVSSTWGSISEGVSTTYFNMSDFWGGLCTLISFTHGKFAKSFRCHEGGE